MNNTPRTDRWEYEQECNFDVPWEENCRQLETELNAAKEQNRLDEFAKQEWHKKCFALEKQLNAANAKIAAMRCQLQCVNLSPCDGGSCCVATEASDAIAGILSNTTPPQEPMVPWRVVSEFFNSERDLMQSCCGDEFKEALKRRDAAREQLQSYAPRQEKGE